MIKFETKFNSDATKQLNSFTMKKIWWLYLLFTLLFVLLGTLNLIGDEPDLIFRNSNDCRRRGVYSRVHRSYFLMQKS